MTDRVDEADAIIAGWASRADEIIDQYAATSAHLFVLDAELTQLEERVETIQDREQKRQKRQDAELADIYERLERLERAGPSREPRKLADSSKSGALSAPTRG